MKRIQLLSSPRNISTAMMYSFANRSDTMVVDEPLYAHYLEASGKYHPGKEEIMASQDADHIKVLNDLMNMSSKEILFIKNMAHHFEFIENEFIRPFTNIFLIRDPKQLIASFSQVIEEPSMMDIGVQKQYELMQYLKSSEEKVIVIDSGELLKDPEGVLKNLCNLLEIQWDEKMLSWPKGSRKEDGVWARFWYKNVHNSTGFQKQKTSDRQLKETLIPLYEEANIYYSQMFEKSIKA